MKNPFPYWCSADNEASFCLDGTLDAGTIASFGAAMIAIIAILVAVSDSRARSRPYVVAEFRIEKYSYKRVTFIIRNAGLTAARDLQVTFKDSETGKQIVEAESVNQYIVNRYKKVISSLAPGQKLENVLLLEEDWSKDFTVSVSYKRAGFLRYKEEFEIQTHAIENHTEAISSSHPDKVLKSISDSLSKSNYGSLNYNLRSAVKALSAIEDDLKASGVSDCKLAKRIKRRSRLKHR